jgi:cell division protein DivIC
MLKILKNKYLLSLIIFGIWMTFFDQNSFMSQIKLSAELNQLQARKNFYLHQNEVLKVQKDELLGSMDNLERLAREKFLMKKDDEDLFIVQTKD